MEPPARQIAPFGLLGAFGEGTFAHCCVCLLVFPAGGGPDAAGGGPDAAGGGPDAAGIDLKTKKGAQSAVWRAKER